MSFEEVKNEVISFLEDSRNPDPSDLLNEHFSGISKEERVVQAKELLLLVSERTREPQTREDVINSGSPGVITMGLHYAHPLQSGLMDWWVSATYRLGMAKNPDEEEKLRLRNLINAAIALWGTPFCYHNYDHFLDRLVPPEDPVAEEPDTRQGLLGRIISLFS